MARTVDHPLVISMVTKLRDLATPPEVLRSTLKVLGTLMVYEVLRDEKEVSEEVKTWVGKFTFPKVQEDRIVLVCILRAALPMLEGALDLVPKAQVGFLGVKRDEETLKSKVYYSKLPQTEGRRVLILDPMLATGRSLSVALEEVLKGNPASTESLHIISAPEGISYVEARFPDHRVYTAAVDRGLNDRGFIVPGLGDMGDRLFSE